MLRNFSYLNSELLDQLVAQVEDGLRSTRTRSASSGTSKGGAVDAKVAKGEMAATSETNDTAEFTDAPAARFNRLLEMVTGHEDEFGWVEPLSDSDLEGVKVGNIVDVAADLYESDLSKMGNLAKTLPSLMNFGEALRGAGSSTLRLPGQGELDAIAAIGGMTSGVGLLGDVVESWKVAFVLPPLNPAVEGEARVVGKVKRIVPPGAFEIIPGTPFIEAMPRDLRRKFISEGPKPGQENMWLEGPALVLSVFAIYS